MQREKSQKDFFTAVQNFHFVAFHRFTIGKSAILVNLGRSFHSLAAESQVNSTFRTKWIMIELK